MKTGLSVFLTSLGVFYYFSCHLYIPFTKLVFEQNRYTLPLILNLLLRCDMWHI